MGRKKNNKNKGRNVPVSVRDAPTMQGMQQVESWDLIDVQPILQGTGNPQIPYLVQLGASVNGWFYDVRQAGSLSPVSSQSFLFGANTGQFAQLSALWSTFRVDSVELIYYPNMMGQGISGPVVSAIDPAGSIGPIDEAAAQIQLAFSRLRTVAITMPYRPTSRRINYSNWLMQTVAEPFLPMISSTGTRPIYPEDPVDDPIIPNIRMITQQLPNTANITLGFLHVRTKITLRGRRGVPLGTTMRITAPDFKDHGDWEDERKEVSKERKQPVAKALLQRK